MLANGQWDAGNRAAAGQRAYWAITTDGELEFGYGRCASGGRIASVGGLHAFNTLKLPPDIAMPITV